jgi:hypothetical protein
MIGLADMIPEAVIALAQRDATAAGRKRGDPD